MAKASNSDSKDKESKLRVVIDPTAAEQGAKKVEDSVDKMKTNVNRSTESMGRSFESVERFLKRATFAIVGFYAAVSANRAIRSFLDEMIDVSTTFTSFLATMKVVKGSMEESRNEYAYLLNAANKLGVSFESVTQSYGKLSASLMGIDKTGAMTRHIFEAISEASVVLHQRGHETNLMFMALEQSASKGKVSLEEFQRQLANKLPGAMNLMARSLDMTPAAMREAITKGSLNVYEVLIRLSNQIKKEYGTSIEYASEQFTAKMNIMKNHVFELYRVIGENGAMKGLIKIIEQITRLLSNSEMGTLIGQTLGQMFEDIAGWIASLTKEDIQSFFLGLTGMVRSLAAMVVILAESFGDVTDGKGDFIDFAEGITKGMMAMTDVALTFVAAIIQIPLSLRSVSADIKWVFAGLAAIPTIASEGLQAATDMINKASEDREQALKIADRNLAILLGTEDSPMKKAWKETTQIFAEIRRNRDAMAAMMKDDLSSRVKDTPVNLKPMTEEQILAMLKDLPPGAPKKDPYAKGIASAFQSEQVQLTRAAGVATSQYAAALNGLTDAQNKNVIQLQAKLKYDADYIRMSQAQKAVLLQLAAAADEAEVAAEGAKLFMTDRRGYDEQFYKNQQQLLSIREQMNPLANEELFQLEQRIKFDARYANMSDSLLSILRDRAKALDELKVALDSANKAQDYANQSAKESYDIETRMGELRKFGYESKYNKASSLINSFKPGGDNQYVSPGDQVSMVEQARSVDNENRGLDMQRYVESQRQSLDNMRFELSMMGKREDFVKRSTAQRQIELEIQKMAVGATEEQILAYEKLQEDLTAGMNEYFDQLNARQQDVGQGMLDGVNSFLDSMVDISKTAKETIEDVMTTMSDGFADSVGRAIVYQEDLNDAMDQLGKQILADLISSIVRMGIQWAINAALGQSISASSAAAATATAAASGTAVAAAWAPAAALVSLATMGANAIPAETALLSTSLLSQSIGMAGLAGFKDGGYTGNYGTSEVAGVVHGREFVVNAEATARNRSLLEAMNSGKRIVSGSQSSGVNIVIENHGVNKEFTTDVSDDRIRVIARDVATQTVTSMAPGVVARDLSNPNSRTSKALRDTKAVDHRRT